MIKPCSVCKKTYNTKQWSELSIVGENGLPDVPHIVLELRQCQCSNTLAEVKCAVEGCKKLATRTRWDLCPICTTHLKLFRKVELAKKPGPAGQQARNDLIKTKFYKMWGKRRQNRGGRIEPGGISRRVPAKLMLEYLERKLK